MVTFYIYAVMKSLACIDVPLSPLCRSLCLNYKTRTFTYPLMVDHVGLDLTGTPSSPANLLISLRCPLYLRACNGRVAELSINILYFI